MLDGVESDISETTPMRPHTFEILFSTDNKIDVLIISTLGM